MAWKNQIIVADAIEYMKNMPDDHVDCIVTDPPYGCNLVYDDYEDTPEAWEKLIVEFLDEGERVCKGAILMTPGWFHNLHFMFANRPPKWGIVWYKGSTGRPCPIGFTNYEMVLVYGKKTMGPGTDHFTAIPGHAAQRGSDHPCPKPDKWAYELIRKFSNVGDIVFDPFTGHGTVPAVAKKMHRRWLACDLSEDYIRHAIMRTEAAIPFLIDEDNDEIISMWGRSPCYRGR